MPKRNVSQVALFLWPCHIILFLLGISGCREANQSLSAFDDRKIDGIIKTAERLRGDGQLKKATDYLDSAFNALQSPHALEKWRKYNFYVYYFLFYDIHSDRAMRYVDSMSLSLKGREVQYPKEFALTFFAHADALIAQKRYHEAFQNYYEGRRVAQKYLDSCTYSNFTYHLGIVRYRQGEYRQAIPYVKQAILKRKDCSNSFWAQVREPQSFLNTLGLCYEKVGELDSAVAYYKHALRLLENGGIKAGADSVFSKAAKGVVLGNLGGVYQKLGKDELAYECLKQSIAINDRPGYEVLDAMTAQIKLIELLIKQGRYKEAYQHLQVAKERLEFYRAQRGDVDYLLEKWYRLRWKYAEKMKDREGIYAYSKRYFEIKDSILTASQGMTPMDMDNAFKVKEQQHNIELLDRDVQIKKVSLIAVVVLVLLMVTIALIIWINLRRSRRNIEELTKLNKQIHLQNWQMQKILGDLEHSQADNTKLMKVVAHDLRNPIEGIRSIVEIMKMQERSDEDVHMLSLITNASSNALELVTDLLNMQTASEDLKKEEVDLEQLLQYCVDLLEHKAKEKQQHLQLDNIKIKIWINREKIWRVLSNLITNAIKFSLTGGIIGIKVEQRDNEVLIAVRDTGIGIPDEIKDDIFDISIQAKRSGTGGEKSYGLGLNISKQIVQLHGGRIWFESEEGKGSVFYVALPIS